MRALIIGMDGAIGAALTAALIADGWDVAGTSRRGRADAVRLDLADLPGDLSALPAADVAFLCAAVTRQPDCRTDPDRAGRVNCDAPLRLAAAVAERGGRTVFLSSAAVFDGTRPARPADDPTCPLNDYGRMKAAAEAGVSATPGGVVVRLTKVLHPDLSLFSGWIAALRAGRTVEAFTDLMISPIALADVAAGLALIGRSGEDGIFQLSGAADISYFTAARHIAARLGADPDLVRTASAAAAGIPSADRPAATSLDADRFTRLSGAPSPDPFDVIDRVFDLPALQDR